MPFTAHVHHGRPYLLGQLSGPATLADLCGAADMLATIAERAGHKRLVVNMLGIEPQLTFTEHLQLGTYVGARFERLDRVATVVTPLNRSGVSEKVAQKTGARLQAFTDLAEAMSWIGAA